MAEEIRRTALGEAVDVAWAPFDGFQTRAMAANADEVFVGGAKGCGKGDILTAGHLRYVDKPAYAGLFLRETFRELERQIDRATQIFGKLSADRRPAWHGEKKRFTWPSRAFVQYGYIETEADLTNYQGGNWSRISYDEVGNQKNPLIVDLLIAELRTADPTIRRQFVGSGNPGFAGHGWCKQRYITPCGKKGERISWSMLPLPDGRTVPWSRQFVPGRITDNPVYANDATYMAQLMLLPERLRRCLLEGDWDAASGMALDELEPAVHLVKSFEVPEHWPYVSAFDWGYDHWAVFMWGRVSDDGRIYVCDTIKRRLLRDWDLAATYNDLVPPQALRQVHAGHDCWHEIKARGNNAPETAQYFASAGIHLRRANIGRPHGYKQMLQYLAWRESEFLPQRVPMMQYFDTPTNRWLLEDHLTQMVTDPDDPRDVLKTNANTETGLGGDDGYDCNRYLVASRPLKALSGHHLLKKSAFDPDVLRRAQEQLMRPDIARDRSSNRLRGLYRGV